MVTTIRFEKHTGSPWSSFPKPKAFFEKIEKWKAGLEPELNVLTGDEETALRAVIDCIENLCVPRRQQYANHDFTRQEIDNLLQLTSQAHSVFGGSDVDLEPVDADVPRPFTGDALLRSVEATAEMMGVSAHTETLLIRLRTLLADAQMKAVIGESDDLPLEKWLENYIGANDASNGCVAVIDLSLVPSEIVHVVIAVTARMVFESLQRHRKLTMETLPTVLVMEEAHTFIKRYKDEVDSHDAAQVCCQVFERIAREGRKFGLGLVISSQRPSELSPTVLSQCNTFLLHRISNDRDQDLVHRFVPDNLRGLLRELPSLPSQHAILLGWASELPILVRMDDLPKDQQPQSDDPDFWNVWLGATEEGTVTKHETEWPRIAADWQGAVSGPPDNSEHGEHQGDEQ